MANINIRTIILLTVALIIMAVILPIGIGLISAAGDVQVTVNNETSALSDLADPTVITLLTILVPILAVISIVLYFIPTVRG